MDEIWNTLYNEALKVLKPRKVSEMLETAGVAAAMESTLSLVYQMEYRNRVLLITFGCRSAKSTR